MSEKSATNQDKALGDFTLTIPKGRDPELGFYVIQINDIDETIWNGAQKLIRQDKEVEAVKLLIRNLRVGGDNAEDICGNFYAIRAATQPLLELIQPLDGTLKKN